ncbi:hypothetical protein F5Y15DRAFT_99470 [Xylariaceae sp. FL0016]|nr:hypothetical protein F5Y15DRAFT_99470 [Xylariaceae sp. FL0016]
MGRRKIEIKAIKDDRNRSVTFLKRKGGLFKKAHELSVLCSVDVAVFIFGSNKKLYEYSSTAMPGLISRYTYHGGPNEHKGPNDFNGGADDDEDDDGEGTPPHGHEGSVEPQMIPPHFQGQPQFPGHLRHHTPSASPPINGMAFVPRGPTPQPQIISRPSSRNDFRRPPSMSQPGGPAGPVNGFAFMPQPAIYNPQNQAAMQHAHGLPPPPPPGQYQYSTAPQAQMHAYVEDQRRSSVPPNYPPQQPQGPPTSRPQPSPPVHHPQLPPQQQVTHMSPPQPPHQHLEPPQHHQQSLPQVQSQQPHEPQPPPSMEPALAQQPERPSQPLLDTASAIKKLPQRKQHSIFTPIDENRSVLSQHLAAFHAEPRIKDEGGSRSQSVDAGTVSRTKPTSPPSHPQLANTSNLPKARNSVSAMSEAAFTPPSRSSSLKVGGGGPRPRLKVQIPDEASDAGSNNTAEETATTSPRGTADTSAQPIRRNGVEAPGVVLPPPSPSASALLSAGATGPPNPFARPAPQSQSNMNIDTPVSALPSRFLNNEFLPSPSSFYPDWNFRGNDSNTLPSPLNFATPVAGSGPSFLRDEIVPNASKRKSPEMSHSGPGSDAPEGYDNKRIKVDG